MQMTGRDSQPVSVVRRTAIERWLFVFATFAVVVSFGFIGFRPITQYFVQRNQGAPIRTTSSVEPAYTRMATLALLTVAAAFAIAAMSLFFCVIRRRPEGLILGLLIAFLTYCAYSKVHVFFHYLWQHGIVDYGV